MKESIVINYSIFLPNTSHVGKIITASSQNFLYSHPEWLRTLLPSLKKKGGGHYLSNIWKSSEENNFLLKYISKRTFISLGDKHFTVKVAVWSFSISEITDIFH